MNFPEYPGSSSPPTVVIDFDGTIAESEWPSPAIGRPIETGVEAMAHYFKQGLEIVIHTARPKSHEARIWAWLQQYNLVHLVHDVVCGKPRGFIYIDDRAWNPFGGEPPTAAPVTAPELPPDPFLEAEQAMAARKRQTHQEREEEQLEAALQRGRDKGSRAPEPVAPRAGGRAVRPVSRAAMERDYEKPPENPHNTKNRGNDGGWVEVG